MFSVVVILSQGQALLSKGRIKAGGAEAEATPTVANDEKSMLNVKRKLDKMLKAIEDDLDKAEDKLEDKMKALAGTPDKLRASKELHVRFRCCCARARTCVCVGGGGCFASCVPHVLLSLPCVCIRWCRMLSWKSWIVRMRMKRQLRSHGTSRSLSLVCFALNVTIARLLCPRAPVSRRRDG